MCQKIVYPIFDNLKLCCCLVGKLCPTLFVNCSLPSASVHGIPRQEYWSGLPFPSPGDLPNPGVEPVSRASPALSGGFFTTEPPGKPKLESNLFKNLIWINT